MLVVLKIDIKNCITVSRPNKGIEDLILSTFSFTFNECDRPPVSKIKILSIWLKIIMLVEPSENV